MAKAKTEEKALTLRDVVDDQRTWIDTIDSLEDGADKEQALVEAAQAALQGRDKTESFCRFIKFLEGQQEWLKGEAKRLTAKAKICENAQARMKEYAKAVMKEADEKRLQGHTYSMTRQPTAAKVVISDEEAVPSTFKRLTLQINAAKFEELVKLLIDRERKELLEVAGEMGIPLEQQEISVSMIDTLAAHFVLKASDTSRESICAAIEGGAEVPGADLDLGGEALVIR